MNVFEDLVIELQEENLLERTTIDPQKVAPAEVDHLDAIDLSTEDDGPPSSADAVIGISDQAVEVESAQPAPAKSSRNGKEFYKKRAVGEVSSLQMVEHVLTGVEREYMRIIPVPFDDFRVKTSLHVFLQVAENERSSEHQEAEFKLMEETQAWCSALGQCDRGVSVANLRQYCENSRPALSSQALLALARFYRNLPYSESVRSKFDFIITRLFSRPADSDKRVCLFSKEETLAHINTLYREWSSISLYAADDDDSKVMLTALSFEDLAVEAEKSPNFDQLISSDFFGRLRMFKESISELFYAPIVTAAAIETNIRIGNAYVSLIDRERQKLDARAIHSKYSGFDEDTVSDAAGRTLELVDLLRDRPDRVMTPEETAAEVQDEQPSYETPPAHSEKPNTSETISNFLVRLRANAFQVNKWLLLVSGILIAASFGLYVWSTYALNDEGASSSVKTVDLSGTPLKDYVHIAKNTGETLYITVTPAWDALTKEKRQEVLKVAYQTAVEKGCPQVILITKGGNTAGFASATRLDVPMR